MQTTSWVLQEKYRIGDRWRRKCLSRKWTSVCDTCRVTQPETSFSGVDETHCSSNATAAESNQEPKESSADTTQKEQLESVIQIKEYDAFELKKRFEGQ